MLDTQILTPKEAADYLKVSPQVVRKQLRRGEIPARKIGRQWRIHKLALDLWLSPFLAQVVPRIDLWGKVFDLGTQIGRKLNLTEQEILKEVTAFRKEHGIGLARRS